MRSISAARAAVAGGLAATLVTGCVTVGPNYHGPPKVAPEATTAPAFRRADASVETGATAPAARWWEALGDAELGRLETAALAASPDLEAAAARIREARAILRQDKANGLPNSGASATYLHAKGLTSFVGAAPAEGSGSSTASPPLDVWSVGLDATWEIDLFGGNRRAVEGARAQTQAYEDDLQAAEVSLTAEVAQAYLSLRDAQTRLTQTRADADLEARTLRFVQDRRAGGVATDLDVERLNDQLLSTRANLEPLGAQITDQLDRLAILTGRAPGDLDAELTAAAPAPLPPAKVEVGDPAQLIRRRPDVRAAERRIAEQHAVIGQRTADLFPKVTLLGDIGFISSDLGQLLRPSNLLYVAAPMLQWTPFDFGRTRAKIAQARATTDEAIANYRKTVLGALDDAESGLARYGRQREEVVALERVKASADRVAQLTELRLQGGTATTVDVLDAERRRVEAEISLEQAQVQLTQDFVTLEKSLGLGWSGPAA